MKDERSHAETLQAVSYRCVCGESFDVQDAKSEVHCPKCDRHYAARALQSAAAQTLSLGKDAAISLGPTGATADDNESDARIGKRLNHFRIISMLGRGGMGAVYKALDESLQRYVALKVINTADNSVGGSTGVEKIVEEARAQARVSHPNVVHIYYVGREESAPYFAMELVAGPPLSARLDEGPLPFDQVVSVALQVVDALEQAAAFDIVHGDIKPSNMLYAGPSLVKLSDFGLAQRLSKADDRTSGIVGTPDYLSPEAANGEPLLQQSDMYSLGVTLFQLTFGRLPYLEETNSLIEKLETHKSAEVEFPDPWPLDVPEPWRDLLQQLLAKDPHDRFASYGQLRDALRKLQPVSLPQAGRLPRALAWFVDLALALAVYVMTFGTLHAITTAAEFQGGYSRLSWVHFLIMSASMLIPTGAIALQTIWGTTPGKRMFQLRVVTPHGLPPSRRIFTIRGLAQFMPLWLLIAGAVFAMILPEWVVGSFMLTGWILLVLDSGFALFHPRGRSLHDWALNTRVVLNTAH